MKNEIKVPDLPLAGLMCDGIHLALNLTLESNNYRQKTGPGIDKSVSL